MRHADDTDTLDRFLLDRNGVGGHVEVTVDVENCNLIFERMTTNDVTDLIDHVSLNGSSGVNSLMLLYVSGVIKAPSNVASIVLGILSEMRKERITSLVG